MATRGTAVFGPLVLLGLIKQYTFKFFVILGLASVSLQIWMPPMMHCHPHVHSVYSL